MLIKDILYEHDYHARDFSKYLGTVKWNADGTVCSWDTSGKGYYSQCNRCRTLNAKANTLLASGTDKVMFYMGNYKCRTPHPIEAERLQTLPDNYTNVDGLSKQARIKGVGNGWTVDVIAHIFKGLKN